eukprot:PITA_16805
MDVMGRSGGLSIGYNPNTIKVNASWGGHGFLGLDLFLVELDTNLWIVNIYGPCQQREHFWKHLLGLSIFSSDHIIIGGDLNFSLGYGESWGSMAQVDSISRFMTDLLEWSNLMDVPMNKPLPTWRNRRVGEATLARRLDRFIMKGPLIQQLHHYKQWVGNGGDDNTRFFQNYAKGRKVTNTIWNLPLPKGGVDDSFNKLSHLGSTHFKNLYKSPPSSNLVDIINVVGHFPGFINEDEVEALFTLVTSGELEGTLKWFEKDKSPGPDGWTIEFYLAFYDLLGQDLLKVVEECRLSGSMYNAINSTFIALIPESDTVSSFNDYRPISLCNCLYKIIFKIIANHLCPILSRHIAPQQFAFLKH